VTVAIGVRLDGGAIGGDLEAPQSAEQAGGGRGAHGAAHQDLLQALRQVTRQPMVPSGQGPVDQALDLALLSMSHLRLGLRLFLLTQLADKAAPLDPLGGRLLMRAAPLGEPVE
jgi:hypothetical protein